MNHLSNHELRKRKVGAARLSVASNLTLTILKLLTGLATGSVSILSEAVHSANDLIAAWIAFFTVRISDLPADEKHPYGHGKVESLSGLAEAMLIVLAAGYILYESIHRLINGGSIQRIDLGFAIMAAAMVVNGLISRRLYQVAQETESPALEADAAHLSADTITSAGVVVGLALTWVTGNTLFDPLVALAVAVFILYSAWKLIKSAVEPLIDTHLPPQELAVVDQLLQADPDVRGYHKVRTRKSGSWRYVDAHVLLDDELSLLEAHAITERLEDSIRGALSNVEITLHTEPFREEMRHQFEKHGGPAPLHED